MTDERKTASTLLKEAPQPVRDFIVRFYLLQLAERKRPLWDIGTRNRAVRATYERLGPKGRHRLYQWLLGLL